MTATTAQGGGVSDSLVRQHSYDPAGHLLSVTEPVNAAANVAYTYDELGRVLSETSRGITHNYAYDIAGNRVRADYGTGRSVQTSYDALNRPENIVEGERATRYGYDLGGRAVILMAGNGQVTSNSYDALGRLTQRTLYRTQGMTEGDVLGYEPGTWVTLFGASYALEHHPYPGTEIEVCHPGQQRQVLHHVVVDDHIEAAGGRGQRLVKVCAQVLVLEPVRQILVKARKAAIERNGEELPYRCQR